MGPTNAREHSNPDWDYRKTAKAMLPNLGRAEQSRLHLNAVRSMNACHSESDPETIKRNAYAECISRVGLLDSDPPTWVILAAADAASEAVYEATGSDVAEFDMASLTVVLGERRLAVMVVRLCGASARANGGKTVFANADCAPFVRFKETLLTDFLSNPDW